MKYKQIIYDRTKLHAYFVRASTTLILDVLNIVNQWILIRTLFDAQLIKAAGIWLVSLLPFILVFYHVQFATWVQNI